METREDTPLALATGAEDYAAAATLFREYAASLDFNLCFQGFERELKVLDSMYAPPEGAIVLAFDGGEAVACCAFRKIDAEACELKRMYVRPAYRERGLGRRMLERMFSSATAAGYTRMRLDTLRTMEAAIGLYRRHGFTDIGAYRFNPSPDTVYMEKILSPAL